MGRIVGGFATSHVLFPPVGVEAAAERVLAGMMQIRARIKVLRPDALVVVASDHMNNFTLKHQVTLAVGVADEYVPLGDMGLPQKGFPGHRPLGEAFARVAAVAGFDLTQVEEVRPDHGMMVTKLIADPVGSIPTVLVYINSNMPVPASPARCLALGRVLKATVESDSVQVDRVVVIAGGGLSHWLRVPEQGRVNAQFDRHFMQAMVEGKAKELAAMSAQELEAQVGNGGVELTGWLCMAGALPQARGEILYYEPMTAWITGMGGLALYE